MAYRSLGYTTRVRGIRQSKMNRFYKSRRWRRKFNNKMVSAAHGQGYARR